MMRLDGFVGRRADPLQIEIGKVSDLLLIKRSIEAGEFGRLADQRVVKSLVIGHFESRDHPFRRQASIGEAIDDVAAAKGMAALRPIAV